MVLVGTFLAGLLFDWPTRPYASRRLFAWLDIVRHARLDEVEIILCAQVSLNSRSERGVFKRARGHDLNVLVRLKPWLHFTVHTIFLIHSTDVLTSSGCGALMSTPTRVQPGVVYTSGLQISS